MPTPRSPRWKLTSLTSSGSRSNPLTSSDILKGNFLKFLWYVWLHVLLLPEPTRVQYDIARFLVGGSKRRFIQAFRGVGKSFITAAFVVWRLWRDPNLKILIVSANETLATEVAGFIRQIIHHEAGDGLWSELKPRATQRDSALSFDVGPAKASKSPSVKAVGITGQLTGSRADIVLSDDVEVPKNSETEAMREKLAEKTREYAAIVNGSKVREIIYLGTPQTEQSIYRGLPERGYEVRVWPARYPLASKLVNYKGFLAPMLLKDIEEKPDLCNPVGSTLGGAPTDTQRFDDRELIEAETEYRDAGFLLQFQLDTTLSDGERYPLKTRDLIVTDVDLKVAPGRLVWGSGPDQLIKDVANVGLDGDRFYRPLFASKEFLPYTGCVMHIDPSGRGRDRTAYVVTKFLQGYIFVVAWGGFQDGYGDETLKALAELCREHQVNLVVPEDNFGDGMFGKLLEPVLARIHPCRVAGERVTGMKEERIVRLLHPVLRQHRLVMDLGVIRADLTQPAVHSGIYQMTHMSATRGALKHDDLVDVLAFAMSYWADYLNADAKKAEDARRAAEEAVWEANFFSHVVGQTIEKPRTGLAARRGRGRPAGRR